jgi:hypothetical protein
MKTYIFRIIRDAEYTYDARFYVKYKGTFRWKWLKRRLARNRTDPEKILYDFSIDEYRRCYIEEYRFPAWNDYNKVKNSIEIAKETAIKIATKYFEAKLKKEKYPGRYFIEDMKKVSVNNNTIKIDSIPVKIKKEKPKKEYELEVWQDEKWQNDYKIALKELK